MPDREWRAVDWGFWGARPGGIVVWKFGIRLIWCWVFLAACFGRPAHAAEPARRALVIGNSAFQRVSSLKNPVHDADLIQGSLEKAGFTVTKIKDASSASLKAAIEKFNAGLSAGDVALLYYSGHGVQLAGDSYILPVDFSPDQARDIASVAPSLGSILRGMESRQVSLKLVFLDACRDDGGLSTSAVAGGVAKDTTGVVAPEGGRSVRGSGLAEVTLTSDDTLVCFATKHGTVAEDNADLPSSRYSKAVAEEMLKPGIKVEDMLKLVSIRVFRESGGHQRPHTYGHLVNYFFFVPDRSGSGLAREAHASATAQEVARPAGTEFSNRLGMTLCWCPPGHIVLGSPEQEEGREARERVFHAHFSQGFWMGKHEVSQEEWSRVTGRDLRAQARRFLRDETLYLLEGRPMTLREWKGFERDEDPASLLGAESPRIPVYYVSWEECVEFCERLTEMEQKSGQLPQGWHYRLPTEAEWEYACRAGSSGAIYSGPLRILGQLNGPELDGVSWYGGNSSVGYSGKGWDTAHWPEKQYPVGKAGPRRAGMKKPNAWGLHDMLGNVWEWCWDWSGDHPEGVARDWCGPESGTERVCRGGSWISPARSCRCATRYSERPTLRSFDLGLRVVLSRSRVE